MWTDATVLYLVTLHPHPPSKKCKDTKQTDSGWEEGWAGKWEGGGRGTFGSALTATELSESFTAIFSLPMCSLKKKKNAA